MSDKNLKVDDTRQKVDNHMQDLASLKEELEFAYSQEINLLKSRSVRSSSEEHEKFFSKMEDRYAVDKKRILEAVNLLIDKTVSIKDKVDKREDELKSVITEVKNSGLLKLNGTVTDLKMGTRQRKIRQSVLQGPI